MICPICSHIQTCPCRTCQIRTPTEKPWINVSGDGIKCAGCGYTNSIDWWENKAYKQYKKELEE